MRNGGLIEIEENEDRQRKMPSQFCFKAKYCSSAQFGGGRRAAGQRQRACDRTAGSTKKSAVIAKNLFSFVLSHETSVIFISCKSKFVPFPNFGSSPFFGSPARPSNWPPLTLHSVKRKKSTVSVFARTQLSNQTSCSKQTPRSTPIHTTNKAPFFSNNRCSLSPNDVNRTFTESIR